MNKLAAVTDTVYKLSSRYGPVIATKGKEIATEQLPEAVKIGAAWAQSNPISATLIATGAVLVSAPAAVTLPIISAFGFTSTGIGAGTAAAAAQATIPNVVAGSWFATFTSAGMGGAGAGVVAGAAQAGGAVLAGTGGVLTWLTSKK